jgi:DNA-binding HxlR family transcriptional regulator
MTLQKKYLTPQEHLELSFAGRTPHTEYRLTGEGRRALESYLKHMEALIAVTREHKPEPRSSVRARRSR